MTQAVRIWRRDNSRNYMSVNAAAENLRCHGIDSDTHRDKGPRSPRGLRRETIAKRLIQGEEMETRHAIFRSASFDAAVGEAS